MMKEEEEEEEEESYDAHFSLLLSLSVKLLVLQWCSLCTDIDQIRGHAQPTFLLPNCNGYAVIL